MMSLKETVYVGVMSAIVGTAFGVWLMADKRDFDYEKGQLAAMESADNALAFCSEHTALYESIPVCIQNYVDDQSAFLRVVVHDR